MSVLYLERENKPRLAYKKLAATDAGHHLPTLVFCGGFRSDMEGTKAAFLEDFCKARGQPYLRFDYSGHGLSGGDFDKGTIGSWTGDTLDIIDECTQGSLVLAGSSMGGWIALLVSLARKERVCGLIGIAAAPDFTQELYDLFDDAGRASLSENGFATLPNDYSDEPYVITKALIDDGKTHCLLDDVIALDIPLRLIQGMQDHAVPWQKAYRIKNALADPEKAEVFLVESGDHSLSRPEDLDLLAAQVIALSEGA